MLESVVALLGVGIAALVYYRTTCGRLPSVDFFAANEDPFDPDWRIRIHNPTQSPVYVLRATIHEPSPERVRNISHHDLSLRGTVERSLKELEAADPGSDHRRVREVHLRIDPARPPRPRIPDAPATTPRRHPPTAPQAPAAPAAGSTSPAAAATRMGLGHRPDATGRRAHPNPTEGAPNAHHRHRHQPGPARHAPPGARRDRARRLPAPAPPTLEDSPRARCWIPS